VSAAGSFWHPDALRAAAGGGRWLRRPVDSTAPVPDLAGLSTDSRSIKPGQVFLALRGENFDGHDFIHDAVRRGAGMAILDTPPSQIDTFPPATHILLVDDSLKALTRLATAYRKSLKTTRFIAVTGSSGKTTTKQMLSAVLSRKFRITASPRSFNNHIGVPLTALSAGNRDQYVICEIGTNNPGEIAALTSIVVPDIGVITGIGRVHIEGLGSLEGVANEKAALLHGLAHGGWAAVNIDEPAVLPHLESMERGVTFGFSTDADLRITECEMNDSGTTFALNDRSRWNIGLHGMHHASNATAAVAVGRRCGLSDAEIRAGLLAVAPPAMRFVRHLLGSLELFDDSYNANPESMKASIRTFRQLTSNRSGRVVVILGDMLELGSLSEAAHLELAEELSDCSQSIAPPHLAILIGPNMRHAAASLHDRDEALSVVHMESASPPDVLDLLQATDRILVKGSRGMRLERVVDAIMARFDSTRYGIETPEAATQP